MNQAALFATGFAALALGISAHAAGPFDGVYRGTIDAESGSGPGCPHEVKGAITVQDNVLSYRHMGGRAVFETNVNPDGSFHATSRNTQLTKAVAIQDLDGRIQGNALQAVTHHQRCTYTIAMTNAK